MLRNVYIATLIPFMKHNMNVLLNALTTGVVNNYYFNLYFCVGCDSLVSVISSYDRGVADR